MDLFFFTCLWGASICFYLRMACLSEQAKAQTTFIAIWKISLSAGTILQVLGSFLFSSRLDRRHILAHSLQLDSHAGDASSVSLSSLIDKVHTLCHASLFKGPGKKEKRLGTTLISNPWSRSCF